jgi:hypothetical protein
MQQTYHNILSAVTLESTYGTAPSFRILTKDITDVCLDIAYTVGGSETNNVILVKLEAANVDTEPASTDWHQVVNTSNSSGTTTVYQQEIQLTGASAGTYYFSLSIKPTDRWLKVSFAESGVSSNKGTVTASATVNNFFKF